MEEGHQPVLAEEVTKMLAPRPGSLHIDCTVGGGGHTERILEAASPDGRVAAAWDDERDGSADVWLSDWKGSEFSDDLAVPDATGPGGQSDPVMLLDAGGTLHLAWLEKTDTGGTRLKYASAVWKD